VACDEHKPKKFDNAMITPTTTMAMENVYNQSATPIETPMLIKDKLAEFKLALADVSDEEERGYLMAKEKGPDECNDDLSRELTLRALTQQHVALCQRHV